MCAYVEVRVKLVQLTHAKDPRAKGLKVVSIMSGLLFNTISL